MQKEEWAKIARWTAYVYLPIVLLAIFIFLLVEWNSRNIGKEIVVTPEGARIASTTP